ncbi:arsenate reductase/protein-tyrosine-phosphatase family protein [Luteipulveratus flavus]|uniref:Low molecular weight phosphatase family protein n=1 Tax=Luteipulveratus flavus TaxID=3031728 RepID=A0ABT6CC15_9MICO|nr:low molecular weight phosphatase family protein [Luteipulveratus sp. YIM 133296]MDF8266448.1 low molecular weight phosphatase family protein [Luteipulveratus sp. YIM 133296]
MVDSGARGSILVVCTGNVCRSPYIEVVLRHHLAGTGIAVTSAGSRALAGSPADTETERALAEDGLTADGFVARQLHPDLVEAADLVITATREHRSAVAQLQPRAMRRAFALTDLADLLRVAVDTGQVRREDQAVAEVVAAATACRADVAPRPAESADIVDPYRRGPAVFAQAADQVRSALPPVVTALRTAVG